MGKGRREKGKRNIAREGGMETEKYKVGREMRKSDRERKKERATGKERKERGRERKGGGRKGKETLSEKVGWKLGIKK